LPLTLGFDQLAMLWCSMLGRAGLMRAANIFPARRVFFVASRMIGQGVRSNP